MSYQIERKNKEQLQIFQRRVNLINFEKLDRILLKKMRMRLKKKNKFIQNYHYTHAIII